MTHHKPHEEERKVRLTWPEILRGLWRWFWYELKKEWKEHNRQVDTWKWWWQRGR